MRVSVHTPSDRHTCLHCFGQLHIVYAMRVPVLVCVYRVNLGTCMFPPWARDHVLYEELRLGAGPGHGTMARGTVDHLGQLWCVCV